ncbi:MAG: InaA protein, partial [Azonexus sp.]|nr:InaA protein [Azonexus sp.]
MSDMSEFDRWWNSQGSWVEPPNQRRGGESGVQILPPQKPGEPPLFSKRQVNHIYRTLLHPFGRPTVLREIKAYQALSRLGIGTPKLIYGAARKQPEGWQGLLVTEALQGFVSLET